ncbi:MAG: esterase family protein [Rubrivivax sp.]|nr:MAG: esterase family protein [Rubrivivax sp.]
MKRLSLAPFCLFAGLSFATATFAQERDVTPNQARANFGRTIVLDADDVRAFAAPPSTFRDERSDGKVGRIETLTYESGVTGTQRKATVYLPAGYSPERKYPVLYLLHGIGGDENEWTNSASAPRVLDNVLAEGKAVPMIVVMPNGRALADDRSPAPDKVFTPENASGFAKFERDLMDFLIPAVQSKYSTQTDRRNRALAGLSMGGGQTLNFGFAHLSSFAWLGGFSSAPNTKPPAELLPDPATMRRSGTFVYLSCGNKDGLINVSQNVHRHLKANGVPHVWNVDGYGHDGDSWAENLHHFAQRIFR